MKVVIKRWLLLVLGLVSVIANSCMFFSFYPPCSWEIKRILHSLPAPTGWVSETDLVATGTGCSPGYRYYDVHGVHSDVVSFFRSELPRCGWQLRGERTLPLAPSATSVGEYIYTVEISFSARGHYSLTVLVGTNLDAGGAQSGDRVVVHMELTDESSCCSH